MPIHVSWTGFIKCLLAFNNFEIFQKYTVPVDNSDTSFKNGKNSHHSELQEMGCLSWVFLGALAVTSSNGSAGKWEGKIKRHYRDKEGVAWNDGIYYRSSCPALTTFGTFHGNRGWNRNGIRSIMTPTLCIWAFSLSGIFLQSLGLCFSQMDDLASHRESVTWCLHGVAWAVSHPTSGVFLWFPVKGGCSVNYLWPAPGFYFWLRRPS